MITFDLASMKQLAVDPKDVSAVAEGRQPGHCELFLRGFPDPFVIRGSFYEVREAIEDAT